MSVTPIHPAVHLIWRMSPHGVGYRPYLFRSPTPLLSIRMRLLCLQVCRSAGVEAAPTARRCPHRSDDTGAFTNFLGRAIVRVAPALTSGVPLRALPSDWGHTGGVMDGDGG